MNFYHNLLFECAAKSAYYTLWISKLMLPNTKHTPFTFSQCGENESVAILISRNFSFPIGHVARWHSTMSCATVPEASINEECNFLVSKNKIGIAEERKISTPAFAPRFAQKADN